MATVTVVTYEWRNWSRDIFAFHSKAEADQHLIQQANEQTNDMDTAEVTTPEAALAVLIDAGHTCYVDELAIL